MFSEVANKERETQMLALKKEYVVEVLPHDLNDLFGGEGTELMFSCSKPVDHHEFDGAGTALYFSCSEPVRAGGEGFGTEMFFSCS